jgi:ribose transport system ATP-binding protein
MTGSSMPRLAMHGIRKAFPGVVALDDVSFGCASGEVHALCGENGAGKSTLMKILGGVYQPDAGEIRIDGVAVRFHHPVEARRLGISIIHQELSLLPDRTVAENIFLGMEPARCGVLDRAAMAAGAGRRLRRLGATIAPDRLARGLSIAEQQIVEIAKALIFNTRILVMDEPTAALDDAETGRLFDLVRQLRDEGVAVVFVSHRMQQVFAIADAITVLKDGRHVGTRQGHEIAVDDVVRMMVGRELEDYYPTHRVVEPTPPLLSIRNGGNDLIDGIDLDVNAGEIVVVVGLEGSGKGHLGRALFGAAPFTRGTMTVAGQDCRPATPRDAIGAGIGYVSDDRKAEGLAMHQSVLENALLALRGLGGILAPAGSIERRGRSMTDVLRQIDVRATSYDQQIRLLSGGNQQKTVLARWLALSPPILICAEPTRGIDVAAKAAIYRLLRRYTDSGKGVLVITSDLPEAIGMADRLVVMHGGRIVGGLPAGATEEQVMAVATGHAMHSDMMHSDMTAGRGGVAWP